MSSDPGPKLLAHPDPYSRNPQNLVTTPEGSFSCLPSAPWAQDYGASSNNKQGPGQRTRGCESAPSPGSGAWTLPPARWGSSLSWYHTLLFFRWSPVVCAAGLRLDMGKNFPGKVQQLKMATFPPLLGGGGPWNTGPLLSPSPFLCL